MCNQCFFWTIGLSLLWNSCATVPIPLATIPKTGNSIKASTALGWNGANLQVAYATKKIAVASLSYQHQVFTRTQMLDLGLGVVSPNHKFLGIFSAGYGQQEILPWHNGLGGAINYKHGHVSRYSVYFIVQPFDNFYLGLRGSAYDGTLTYERNGSIYYGHSFTNRFSSLGIEPTMFGQTKGFIYGLGIHKMYESGDHDEKLFDPWPIWIVFGYQFGKNF